MSEQLYYYWHAESDCLWKSTNKPEVEMTDPLIDELTKEQYDNLKKELNL